MRLKAYETDPNPQKICINMSTHVLTMGKDASCETHQCCSELTSSHISLNWERYTLLGSRALDLLDLSQQELQSKLLFWVFLHSRHLQKQCIQLLLRASNHSAKGEGVWVGPVRGHPKC